MEKFIPQVRADLQEVYGVDLPELFQKKRWKHLLALIDGLPSHSRYIASVLSDPEIAKELVNSPEFAEQNQDQSPSLVGYSQINYQLADVIDALKSLQATQVATAGGSAKPPKPVPRPKTAIQEAREKRRKKDQQDLLFEFTPTE